MHVISRKKLREFAADHPDAEAPLDAWYRVTKRAQWENSAELQAGFPAADKVGPLIVFGIDGDKYWLITKVAFVRGEVCLRAVFTLTPQEYDRGEWKRV